MERVPENHEVKARQIHANSRHYDSQPPRRKQRNKSSTNCRKTCLVECHIGSSYFDWRIVQGLKIQGEILKQQRWKS